MLLGKRKTYDGDGQHQGPDKVVQSQPDTTEQDPQDIHDHAQASGRGIRILDRRAKGPKADERELEHLQSEGNPNDGETHQKPGQKVMDEQKNSPEQEPYDVSQY